MIPRNRTRTLVGALIIVLAAACASGVRFARSDVGKEDRGDDPVGSWKLKCVPPDGKPRECVVAVFREGDVLKGHYIADGETRPANKVAFDGGLLSIEVDGKFAGRKYGLTYQGAPKGDALKGSVRWSFGWASGTFPFDGQRLEQQVASAR